MPAHAEGTQFRDYIDSFELWHHLTNVQRDRLAAHTRFMHCMKGESVHRGPLEKAGILHVVSGVLRIYMLSEEGRAFTLCLMRAGDVALLASTAFLSSVSCNVSIEAAEDTKLFASDSDTVRRIFEANVRVRAYAYELAVHRLSEMVWKFQQVLFIPAERRLAKFLLAESERTDGDEIRLTHEQTAQSLGTAREVVSRLMREFSQDGLVRTSRGRIHILDRAALRRRAGV